MGNNSSVESSEEFSEKIDIGLSATVTITDNRWSASSDLEFKGPFQHPASALFHIGESNNSTASSPLEQITGTSFLNNTGNIQGDDWKIVGSDDVFVLALNEAKKDVSLS
ncbi:uncharacterized protein DS421_1g06480 [Arachis hypogaea]|nr:uncharacterized protein DS421_1g06480 [Arachis hypogaea]